MRNERDGKIIFAQMRNREAYAVECDRAFGNDVFHDFCIRRKCDAHSIVVFFFADDFADAVDMTAHDMTAETEALLYAAARAQLVRTVIRPALDAGKTVICDRYIDSSVAYQGFARGLGRGFVEKVNAYAMETAMPDVTIFIDLRPSSAFRSVSRNDRLEQENISFHDKVYEGYIAQSAASNGRFVMIKPEKERLETHRKILDALKKRGAVK